MTTNSTDDDAYRTSRRHALVSGAGVCTALLAGCTGDTTDDGDVGSDQEDDDTKVDDDVDPGEGASDEPSTPALPQVEDPPAAVYVPTHFESMHHIDPVDAGEFELVPMVTYPHQFWNVTGTEVEPAEPSGDDDVHLMVTVRDPETGAILPAETGLELTVGPQSESGSTHSPWPMISQEMGFHLGDNVPLGPDGTYEVEVRVGAITVDRTGEFAGRFEEPGRGSFTFEFDDEFRETVVGGIHYLDEDEWGRRGALANHVAMGHHDHGHGHDHDHDDHHHRDENDHDHGDHEGPHHDEEPWTGGDGHHRFGTYVRDPDAGELPPAEHLPGTVQGTPMSGDAVFATTLLAPGSRFADDSSYLAVSPRTPYNRSMLPMMALSYELERNGDVVSEGPLTDVLDHELGYHYATPLEDAETGDVLTIYVETPPQVSRHAGYETAFLDMPSVSLELEGLE